MISSNPYHQQPKSGTEAFRRDAAENSADAPIVVLPPGSDPGSVGIPNAAVYQPPCGENAPLPAREAAECGLGTNGEAKAFSAFLSRYAGRYIRLSFRPEPERREDRIGVLLEAGENHLALRDFASRSIFLCRTDSVQTVSVYDEFFPDTN